MRRSLLLMLVLCLALSVTAAAEEGDGMKGWALVSGYGGYTFGFGDLFFDETIAGVNVSFEAGLSFGGAFHYGLTDKFFLGGELGFQSYKTQASLGGLSASTTDTKLNILASGLYALNYVENQQALFLAFGAGQYSGLDEFGFNAGVLYTRMAGDKFAWFVMPRFHYVLTDPSGTMVQVVLGVTLPVAGRTGP
ncbi:MAG: hypothetical protein OEV49_04440 [candidate division Zixibacteria bacterium]|nr:hypothetical protein [candidate division Zixibacteria bacterium]MDH3936156.1 hypothetical protein [candidate division Zixibacteria bacterium]MDH4032992.1 hypothetical protein [candidate division Zixibacteria bacterium]